MRKVAGRCFTGVLAVICLLPFLTLFFRSFMSLEELELGEFHLFPTKWSFRQYESILLMNKEYFYHFWNSVKYVSMILLFDIPLSMLAGYGFSQYRFRGRNMLFFLYIILMLMPFQATLVPQYLTLKWFNLLNTKYSVILPNIFHAFGVFLMTQYMEGIDKELIEAGRIDGLGDNSCFLKLIVPLCKPAVSALLILSFLDYRAMIEKPVVFLRDPWLTPLSVQLNSISSTGLLAGGILFSILPLLIYSYGYQDLIEGIHLSSLK